MPTDPRLEALHTTIGRLTEERDALAAIPAIRRLAEEDVRDTWARHVRLFRTSAWAADSTWVDDPDDAPDAFAVCVDAAVEKLADMERPASQDAVARLVAEAVGLDTTRGVLLARNEDGEWEMGGPGQAVIFSPDFTGDPAPPDPSFRGTRYRLAPWLSDVHDPAEALTLIALHVLGRTP